MRIFSLLFIFALLASCKAPLPVYFDKPVGIQKDSFPEFIQGNYYPMEEVVSKGLENFESKFYIKNGKIELRDTSKIEVKEEITEIIKVDSTSANSGKDTLTPVEENNFYKIAQLNSLTVAHLDTEADSIDKSKKIAFAFIKISRNAISLVIRDSSADNHEVNLVKLGENIKLSYYSEDYYLNFKTLYGWEYLKIESWNKGEFLNIIPFYFTNYNDKTGDVKVFLKSTAEIYPDLKPVYNDSHIIIGVKAVSNPKVVKEKFKNSEDNIELIKVR